MNSVQFECVFIEILLLMQWKNFVIQHEFQQNWTLDVTRLWLCMMASGDQPKQHNHTKTNVCGGWPETNFTSTWRFVGVSNSRDYWLVCSWALQESTTWLSIITASISITGVVLHINQCPDCQPEAMVWNQFVSSPALSRGHRGVVSNSC